MVPLQTESRNAFTLKNHRPVFAFQFVLVQSVEQPKWRRQPKLSCWTFCRPVPQLEAVVHDFNWHHVELPLLLRILHHKTRSAEDPCRRIQSSSGLFVYASESGAWMERPQIGMKEVFACFCFSQQRTSICNWKSASERFHLNWDGWGKIKNQNRW